MQIATVPHTRHADDQSSAAEVWVFSIQQQRLPPFVKTPALDCVITHRMAQAKQRRDVVDRRTDLGGLVFFRLPWAVFWAHLQCNICFRHFDHSINHALHHAVLLACSPWATDQFNVGPDIMSCGWHVDPLISSPDQCISYGILPAASASYAFD